jgi:hypothetical protein
MTSFKIKDFFATACLATFLFNLYRLYKGCFNKQYGVDDFEHIHVVWRTFQGDLIYKDFFEHHGPLYYFVTKLLFFFENNIASYETFTNLRQFSFFFTLLTCVLLFLIVKNISGSYTVSLLSLAFYSAWNAFLYQGQSIRPDTLHNFLMYLGIYLLIKNLHNRDLLKLFFVGLIFGLMIMGNFKMIVVIAALAVFYILEALIKRNWNIGLDFIYILLGVLAVFTLFALYFFFQGALSEFVHYNTTFNFTYTKHSPWGVEDAFKRNTVIFFQTDLLLTIFSIISIFFLNFKKVTVRFLAIMFFITLYGTFHGCYIHYSLVYLPIVSYAAANFACKLLKNFFKFKISLILSFILALIFFSNFYNKLNYIVKQAPNKKLLEQKKQLDWALKNIPRDEIVSIQRRGCSASVFFKDRKYFWRTGGAESYAAQEVLWETLPISNKNNRYFFMYPKYLKELPPWDLETLDKEYQLLPISSEAESNCIWQRLL